MMFLFPISRSQVELGNEVLEALPPTTTNLQGRAFRQCGCKAELCIEVLR
jgi:hypothetical protein